MAGTLNGALLVFSPDPAQAHLAAPAAGGRPLRAHCKLAGRLPEQDAQLQPLMQLPL